ncbi:MarR family transcriptional regulator [Kiloniella laminariae]|uniref:MarR family transcriptional regulator n=1 Tax=Kiloniella laminariae TaxID=454162 RepID=UPI0003700EDC|nr:MarR family transcriptional regulator [Kiloniella laminariae]
MSQSFTKNWWKLPLDFLLYQFIEDNIFTSAQKWKALSLMYRLISLSGGFDNCAEVSQADLAREFNERETSISATLKKLEGMGLIAIEHDGQRGNRRVITPLNPKHWVGNKSDLFANYKQFSNTSVSVHQDKGLLSDKDHIKDMSMKHQGVFRPTWEQYFNFVREVLEKTVEIPPSHRSKIIDALLIVAENTKEPGERCSLTLGEISSTLHVPTGNFTRLLNSMLSLELIQLEVMGRSKYIIPTLPSVR